MQHNERQTMSKNTFEITARIDRVDSFTSKAGKEIITVVLQTEGSYPQLVPIKFFGRMAEEAKQYAKGDAVEITGELGGREYNGRVYGENIGRAIDRVGAAETNPAGATPATPTDDHGSVPF